MDILSFLYRNLYNKWDFEGERNAEITLLYDLLNLLEEPSVTLLMHLLIYVVTNLIKNVQLLRGWDYVVNREH